MTAHDIRPGNQTWESVQALYGRESVWDIIVYNFNTTNPLEINWYLGNPDYVGCVLTTGDRKNYRFSSKANPGKIYIPPASWSRGGPIPTPPPPPTWQQIQDAAARASVVRVLRGGPVGAVRFTWGSARIDRAALQGVADLIDAGRISVAWDPEMRAGRAAYDSDSNGFFLSNPNASGAEAEAIIVHEAAHALLDLQGKPMSMLESEGVGYLAQAMYFLDKAEHHLTGSPALRMASEIADGLLYQNKTFGHIERGRLMLAVYQTPLYRSDRNRMANFNGIP